MNGRPARRTWLDAIVAALALSVVVAGVLLAFAIAYPEGIASAGGSLRSVSPGAAGAATAVAGQVASSVQRAADGWEYRVFGPVRSLMGASSSEETASAPSAGAGFPVDGCEECHPHWQERPLFSVVYFDHPIHEQVGVECESCHARTGPMRDTVPRMSGCGECHREWVSGRSGCLECHPPGSLFHGADLAGDREVGFICETCHRDTTALGTSVRHDMPVFDESDPESCNGCHDAAGFCTECHPPTHGRGYVLTHPARMRSGAEAPLDCWECHDARWCSMACHAKGAR